MNINEKELFAPYLEEEKGFHNLFRSPFTNKGFVCATNGYLLLMVKSELITGQYEERHLPITSIGKYMDVVLTLEDLQQAIADSMTGEEEMIIQDEIVCPECQGEKQLLFEYHGILKRYEHYVNCPHCRGEGILQKRIAEKTEKKVLSPNDCISIDGIPFRSVHIQKMCNTMLLLGINKVSFIKPGFASANVFSISDDIYLVIKSQPEKTKVSAFL